MDDFSLLDAWKDGDRAAGNELFDRHFDSIYRFFLHKVGGEVEDVVQRTFLSCIEARDRFRMQSSFRTFLFAIARNELCAHYRSIKKHAALDFGVSSLAEIRPSPSTMARHRGQTRLLLEALDAIPVDLQVALELHYLEGLRGPELAVVLEIPEGTVRSRLRRGREQVVAKLAELGASEMPIGPHDDFGRWASVLREHLADDAAP